MSNHKRKQWLTATTSFVFGVIFLSACGKSPTASSAQIKTNKLASGSSTANANQVKLKFNSLNSALDSFKQQKQALCQPDESLQKSIQSQLDAIDKNTSLSRSQKQQAAELVFKNNQSKLDAEKNRMESCIAKNQNQWDAISEQEQPYLSQCLPAPQQDKGQFGGAMPGPSQSGNRMPPPPPPFGAPNFDQMDSSQLGQFDDMLSSNGCQSLLGY